MVYRKIKTADIKTWEIIKKRSKIKKEGVITPSFFGTDGMGKTKILKCVKQRD